MPVQEQEEVPEPPRPVPLAERIWRIVGSVLEVAALVAAHQQHEGLAVAAKALAVLGGSTVVALTSYFRR
ncbi:hypothetical protein [Plantactinospora sp. CA-290183]|uniref:hypothetical protein n=1 Tax=Plantactinospora sp. CA-290183 TaxID=3240006 RepID=UPI003D8CDC6B